MRVNIALFRKKKNSPVFVVILVPNNNRAFKLNSFLFPIGSSCAAPLTGIGKAELYGFLQASESCLVSLSLDGGRGD